LVRPWSRTDIYAHDSRDGQIATFERESSSGQFLSNVLYYPGIKRYPAWRDTLLASPIINLHDGTCILIDDPGIQTQLGKRQLGKDKHAAKAQQDKQNKQQQAP